MGASLSFFNHHAVPAGADLSEVTLHPLELDEQFEVQMCNSNARFALSALGFAFEDGMTEAPVRELEAACTRFFQSEMGEVVDGGIEPTRRGNSYDCGRRPGYLAEVAQRIHAACGAAIAKGATHALFA